MSEFLGGMYMTYWHCFQGDTYLFYHDYLIWPEPQIHVPMYDLIHMIPPQNYIKYVTYFCFYHILSTLMNEKLFPFSHCTSHSTERVWVKICHVRKVGEISKLVGRWNFSQRVIIEQAFTYFPTLGEHLLWARQNLRCHNMKGTVPTLWGSQPRGKEGPIE